MRIKIMLFTILILTLLTGLAHSASIITKKGTIINASKFTRTTDDDVHYYYYLGISCEGVYFKINLSTIKIIRIGKVDGDFIYVIVINTQGESIHGYVYKKTVLCGQNSFGKLEVNLKDVKEIIFK